jgi:hypothetical protein
MGNLYVAVGAGGTILTSVNGSQWTAQVSGTQASLYSIAASPQRFVAVGNISSPFTAQAEQRVILTSTNGTAWTLSTLATASLLNTVAWTGSQFVIAGGSGALYTSPDGLAWTKRETGTTTTLNEVASTENRIVIGGNSSLLLTSSNAVTWDAGSIGEGAFSTISALVWTGTGFFALATTLRYSPDGTTWTTKSRPSNWNSLAWTGSRLIASGISGASGRIFHSTDGVLWDTVPVPENVALTVHKAGNLVFAFGPGGAILTSPDGIAWTVRRTSNPVTTLQNVIWTGTQFVAVGYGGLIVTSPDGSAWTQRTSGVTGSLNGVAWTGSQLVAVGATGTTVLNSTSLVLTSPDGITWTQRNAGSNSILYSVSAKGGLIAAVGDSNTVLTSPDGISWTRRDVPSNGGYLRSITTNGSLFVAVGRLGTVLTSSDGITWTGDDHTPAMTPENPNLATDLQYVAWLNNEFIAKGGKIYRSPDGTLWTEDTTVISAAFPTATQAWNGVQYISVGTGGLILNSSQIPTTPATVRTERLRVRVDGLNLRITGGSVLFAEIPASLRGAPARATIRSLSGEKRLEAPVWETAFSLDLGPLPRGVYVLELRNARGRATRAFALSK